MSELPTLYSFRRCPYAMRGRMALLVSGIQTRLREVVLREKPVEMLAASAKGTVPVLVLSDGMVIDESLDLMLWALEQNDPENWLDQRASAMPIIEQADGSFKDDLDRYKYPTRYADVDPLEHRASGLKFLQKLNGHISEGGQIIGARPGLADYAIFPFVRQFANHDRSWFDVQPLAPLQKWLTDHLESAILQQAMARHPQWLSGHEEPIFGEDLAA